MQMHREPWKLVRFAALTSTIISKKLVELEGGRVLPMLLIWDTSVMRKKDFIRLLKRRRCRCTLRVPFREEFFSHYIKKSVDNRVSMLSHYRDSRFLKDFPSGLNSLNCGSTQTRRSHGMQSLPTARGWFSHKSHPSISRWRAASLEGDLRTTLQSQPIDKPCMTFGAEISQGRLASRTTSTTATSSWAATYPAS